MSEIKNPARDAAERIARAHAAAVPADNQGRPIGAPSTFTYDRDGRLVTTERGTEPTP